MSILRTESMRHEDIIAAAREACDKDKVDAWHGGFWTLTQEELKRFADIIASASAAREREACAKVCEAQREQWQRKTLLGFVAVLDDAAAAIRARGDAA